MEQEVVEQVLTQAKQFRAEQQKLSALLLLPEVCADSRLAAHYDRRMRALEPLVTALVAYESSPRDAALTALRREVILLSLSEASRSGGYAGAGVCVRTRIYNEKDPLPAYGSVRAVLLSLLPKGCECATEVKSGYCVLRFMLKGAYSTLQGLKAGMLGEGVTFAVFPILAVPRFSMGDVKVDIFLNGGKGGQNVNKVETAVRVTHLPTGVTVTCRDERSQLQNKKRAMSLLQKRVAEYYVDAQSALVEKAKNSLLASSGAN